MEGFYSTSKLIEAFKFGEDPEPDWFEVALIENRVERASELLIKGYILGPFTTIPFQNGDYIIRTGDGTIYSLKEYIFKELFSKA